MPERQPGRPTEDEFSRATLRFVKDDYQVETIHVSSGFYTNVIHIRAGKSHDADILRREQAAEGLRGDHETLLDFAVRRLAEHQKQRRIDT